MSILVTTEEMKAAEKAAIASGISEEALMDQAGQGLADFVEGLICPACGRGSDSGGQVIVYAGKGHNGADAMVAADIFGSRRQNWRIEVRFACEEADLRPLAAKKWAALAQRAEKRSLDAPLALPPRQSVGTQPLVVLDGLLGVGSTGDLSGTILEACRQINRFREQSTAQVVAVDLPTGLDGTSGRAAPDTVVADATVTFGFAKQGLVADNATKFVGRLEVVPLRGLAAPDPKRDFVLTEYCLRPMLPPRRHFDTHKGMLGRVGMVAGNVGCVGAARLAALGAQASGAGLTTLFVPEKIYEIAATAAEPEIMVRPLADLEKVSCDAYGIGPGLGAAAAEVASFARDLPKPVVFDADFLNFLSCDAATARKFLSVGHPRICTPHPGEMARMWAVLRPEMAAASRAEQARAFASEFSTTLLLKGSRTVIAGADHPLAYNATGTPAMASGGQGDVLTGILTTLLAQGVAPHPAACLGSWLLGRAAELATHQAYLAPASVVARQIPAAIFSLRQGC